MKKRLDEQLHSSGKCISDNLVNEPLYQRQAACIEKRACSLSAAMTQSEVAPGTGRDTADVAEIYRLLGFATMSGEDPLTMWGRLKNTATWLVGPLSPDSWAGQVFIADHADIFAFRFLALPAAWSRQCDGGRPALAAAERSAGWWAGSAGWWETIGPKAPDDSYASMVWQMPDSGPRVTYEWARTDKMEVVCRISLSAPSDLVLQAYAPWDDQAPRFSALYAETEDRRFLRGRSWVPGTRDGMRWVLGFGTPPADTSRQALAVDVPVRDPNRGRSWHGYFRDLDVLYLCGRQGQKYDDLERAVEDRLDTGAIDAVLAANLERYWRTRPTGSGWLADVPAAINDQLEWNEVYTPQRRRPYITVSRTWAEENNSCPDFLWDSFFNALLVCQEDEARCLDMVRDITSWQNEQGMFAQYGQWISHPEQWKFPVAWGHTQYPVGALAVAKIYLRRPNRDFLEEVYPRLLQAHRWFFADRGDGQPWRDGNRNGLLELGSNYPVEIPYEDRQQVAYFESHDDSPQWWHVARYNEQTETIEQDVVERNCLYTMDCWILAWMADLLGRAEDARALRAEHATMAERINSLLWDPVRQCYFNRRWQALDGNDFYPQMAPDVFLSLLGRVADPEREARLRTLFHDPAKFAGQWILPTISRDDPAYPEQHYWRGKVWAPINWLVYQGFKIYDWDREARLLAESSAEMFLRQWRERGRCYENFLATTGEGSSDPHYTWGAMMALIAVEELVDANPWHGLRFGNLDPVAEAAINRYHVAGSSYDVALSPQWLEVRRDSKHLFSADAPVEIRHVRYESGAVHFQVRSPRPCVLRAGSAAPAEYPAGLLDGVAGL